MSQLIRVGMADLKVCKHPDRLSTLGLGSCVGVVIYDEIKKVAGMAHVMLPDSKQAKATGNPAKFADTAIPLLIKEVENIGGDKKRFKAKMAGGAQMFAFSGKSEQLSVGKRNVEAVKKWLKEFNIPIVAEDTGGNHGRSIEFRTVDLKLVVNTIGKGTKEI